MFWFYEDSARKWRERGRGPLYAADDIPPVCEKAEAFQRKMSTSTLVCSPTLSMHAQPCYLEGASPEEGDVQLFTFPYFTCYQTPSRTPTSLVLPAASWSPSNCVRAALFTSPPGVSRVDFVCRLPPEVAVKILAYLSPEDLCR